MNPDSVSTSTGYPHIQHT